MVSLSCVLNLVSGMVLRVLVRMIFVFNVCISFWLSLVLLVVLWVCISFLIIIMLVVVVEVWKLCSMCLSSLLVWWVWIRWVVFLSGIGVVGDSEFVW